MVHDGINHQPAVASQARYVVPGTERVVDLAVVDYRESFVGTRWVEGQHMNAAEHLAKLAAQH